MKRSELRKMIEEVLEEKMSMKDASGKFPSHGQKRPSKHQYSKVYRVEIEGKFIGVINKNVDPDNNWGSGGSRWELLIYAPGTKKVVYKDYMTAAGRTGDPNTAIKKVLASARTNKSLVRAIEAHGVTLKGLHAKHRLKKK